MLQTDHIHHESVNIYISRSEKNLEKKTDKRLIINPKKQNENDKTLLKISRGYDTTILCVIYKNFMFYICLLI